MIGSWERTGIGESEVRVRIIRERRGRLRFNQIRARRTFSFFFSSAVALPAWPSRTRHECPNKSIVLFISTDHRPHSECGWMDTCGSGTGFLYFLGFPFFHGIYLVQRTTYPFFYVPMVNQKWSLPIWSLNILPDLGYYFSHFNFDI